MVTTLEQNNIARPPLCVDGPVHLIQDKLRGNGNFREINGMDIRHDFGVAGATELAKGAQEFEGIDECCMRN